MNLTLSVDDELVERARQVAASEGTSLQALVRAYIESLAGQREGDALVAEIEDLWRTADKELEERGGSKPFKFNREEIYAERLDRMLKGKK
jgi:hypothetical protein